jgi:hypothetical protein
MKLKPLKQWYCDSCRKIISCPEDGWFEWYSYNNNSIIAGFRIVHHQIKCQYNEKGLLLNNKQLRDLNLTDILGEDGLGFLLLLIEESETGGEKLENINEILEIIRRTSIPYWEQARFYWQEALSRGYNHVYTKERLLSIIEEHDE